jgi:hypothetical protein
MSNFKFLHKEWPAIFREAIEAQKTQTQASLAGAEDLFNSLLQKAFKGELV